LHLAAKKTGILDEMLRLCLLYGLSELAYACECARASHFLLFPNSVAIAAMMPSAGSYVSGGSSCKRGCKNRLANVAPETPDQMIDKKVAEKCRQIDRAYVQLETMTTPTGSDARNYPRHNSVLITISECKPNSGGGNRTKPDSVEQKRRDGTLVVIRSMDSSVLKDGTLKNSLAAALEKLKVWNDEHKGGDYNMLNRQDRFHIECSPFDVAVALDWKTYYQHVYTEESSFVRQKRTKISIDADQRGRVRHAQTS
jgi:hypothetical protein